MSELPADIVEAFVERARSTVMHNYCGGMKQLCGRNSHYYLYLRSYSLSGTRSANLNHLRSSVISGFLVESRPCEFMLSDTDAVEQIIKDAVAYWEGLGYMLGVIMMPPGMAAKPEHLNAPELLPPVECPLVIDIGGEYRTAERTGHISDRDSDMNYRLHDGLVISGRFAWTYP